jgi:hypothetical protein
VHVVPSPWTNVTSGQTWRLWSGDVTSCLLLEPCPQESTAWTSGANITAAGASSTQQQSAWRPVHTPADIATASPLDSSNDVVLAVTDFQLPSTALRDSDGDTAVLQLRVVVVDSALVFVNGQRVLVLNHMTVAPASNSTGAQPTCQLTPYSEGTSSPLLDGSTTLSAPLLVSVPRSLLKSDGANTLALQLRRVRRFDATMQLFGSADDAAMHRAASGMGTGNGFVSSVSDVGADGCTTCHPGTEGASMHASRCAALCWHAVE